ncbi:hypothetical protein [Tenacibaculum haliotis]|uniref:hypothetical protein n=1 Tax=Tenacibaculum haliotis TaxID=1888914 RepID=UPI0021B00C69|nr:hypothetical protein [Tenacibaculum haliotis]MCT4697527.1 hypothetical protein [Tenacibaculum haliotis]
MKFSKDYKEFGEIIVKKLRDENFEFYEKSRDYGKSISIKDYSELSKNPNIAPELQKLSDERFEFFNSLTEKQTETLNKIVLNILDSTAFNFLREIEENLEENGSIGLTINGKKIENITSELLSGTLFGEYFLWVEKNSKYGEFQQ